MLRHVITIVCAVVLFIIVFGIVASMIGANRKVTIKARKKYVTPQDKAMDEILDAAGLALKERVTQEYTITNRKGIRLHGYLVRPDVKRGEPAPSSDRFIFCSHSYHSRLAAFEFGQTAPIWLSQGYNLFLVDHRAHGKSGGNWISFGQYESDDCIEWLQFMKREFGEDIRVVLYGQSMGAATVLIMSGKNSLPDNVRCVISDSGYTNFYDELWGVLPLPKFMRSVTLLPMQQALVLFHRINMKHSDAVAAVRHARVPILFLHGRDDKLVPLWMNEKLVAACTGEKERILFDGATHIRSCVCDPERYERAVSDFVNTHF